MKKVALEHVRHGGDVILVVRKATKVHALAAELHQVAPDNKWNQWWSISPRPMRPSKSLPQFKRWVGWWII